MLPLRKSLGLSLSFIVLAAQAFSQTSRSPQQEFECLKEKGLSAAETMGETRKFIADAYKFMEATGAWKPAMSAEQMRLNLAQRLVGPMAVLQRPLYQQTIGPEGEKSHNFRLIRMMSKDWKDKTKVSQYVEAICSQYHAPVADFCIESFWKKQDNIFAFLQAHSDKINELSENQPRGSETWADKIQGYEFKTDEVTLGNLGSGFSTWIGPQDLVPEVLVTDSKGLPVGMLMSVLTNGQPKYYVAELIRSSNPFFPKFVNPYFFMFGTDNPEEWNARVVERHGELKIDGSPLSAWIQSNS